MTSGFKDEIFQRFYIVLKQPIHGKARSAVPKLIIFAPLKCPEYGSRRHARTNTFRHPRVGVTHQRFRMKILHHILAKPSRVFGSLRGIIHTDARFFAPLPVAELEAWEEGAQDAPRRLIQPLD